jgi:Xaa-Pro aminopeptidase
MNIKFLIAYSILIWSQYISGQNLLPKDYLSADFHKGRREALRKKLPPNSVAIFMTNPIQNRSNDVDYIYHQDPNFYYLSGYKEPHGMLLIFSEPQRDGIESYDEILYVQERNSLQEQWTGYRLGTEGAKEKLGFKKVFNGIEFINSEINFTKFDNILVLPPKTEYPNDPNNPADSFKLLLSLKEKLANLASLNQGRIDSDINLQTEKHKIDSKGLKKVMTELRQIKTKDEIFLLTKAAKISAIGQREIMKAIHPNMSETEIQGIHEFIYKKYGSEHEGYPSIVGAGSNGCVLHYIENNKTKVENELVLMDLGAEYHGYTADVTRTIPANGKFTEAQKTIYNLVLKAQNAGIQMAIVGSDFECVDQAAREVINQGLLELGIINRIEEGDKYFPHATGHYLGLDVHDLGDYKQFQPNMVITVEPGIYIPNNSDCDPKWHGIAIRIEDDILITEKGNINLSKDAPREIWEIETLMKEHSALNALKLPNLD